MPAILIATEADEGMGHVAPWHSFVAQALAQNYQVHMAAPDVGLLNQLIGGTLAIAVWQSPRLRSPGLPQPGAPSPSVRSWPELLVSLGYAQPVPLAGAVKAWCSMLQHIRPSVVVADYAPALMLAAQVADIPVLEVGGGFCVPPLSPPQQSFPGVGHFDSGRAVNAGQALTAAFNHGLAQFGKSGRTALLQSLGDLQAWPAARVVCAPAELDPYGSREDVVYAGLLKSNADFGTAMPPATAWPRVVGYLKAGTPGLDALIAQMAQANIEALVHIAGDARTHNGPRQLGSVTLTHQPINLTQALEQADVYLSNGGLHGVGLALQKGCWPVLAPQQAEQVAMARNLVQRNWGGLWLANSGHTPQAAVQQVFAARPRTARLPLGNHAEEKLLQLIAALTPEARHVQPA